MLMGLVKLLYPFVGWNFSDMEQIELGSRKYGHRIFGKNYGGLFISLTRHVLFFLDYELRFLGLECQKGCHCSLIQLARVLVWLYNLLEHSFLALVEISR